MFLAQELERVNLPSCHGWRLIRYKVKLDSQNRPVWELLKQLADYGTSKQTARRLAKNRFYRAPLMSGLGPNKRVTKRQAEILTGKIYPAAMDDLVERVAENNAEGENYVKPPKPPKPPKAVPTPAQVANAKADRADKMVARYEAKVKRYQNLVKKWQRRADRAKRKAATSALT